MIPRGIDRSKGPSRTPSCLVKLASFGSPEKAVMIPGGTSDTYRYRRNIADAPPVASALSSNRHSHLAPAICASTWPFLCFASASRRRHSTRGVRRGGGWGGGGRRLSGAADALRHRG